MTNEEKMVTQKCKCTQCVPKMTRPVPSRTDTVSIRFLGDTPIYNPLPFKQKKIEQNRLRNEGGVVNGRIGGGKKTEKK